MFFLFTLMSLSNILKREVEIFALNSRYHPHLSLPKHQSSSSCIFKEKRKFKWYEADEVIGAYDQFSLKCQMCPL